MTEELVTLETAKLLKEKGFNEYHYPIQSIAAKWLREAKGLHIEISYSCNKYWYYDILTIPKHDFVGLANRPFVKYNTYEEALEAGIQEALKLI
ncbi:hypothetical protein [Bacteroides clarus]|uniref:hypothetical protein n=1 Tax=Bacteroides clarus TaxID=626929 RepID=UPI0020492E4A|nr:hypothetical protein [Bacteroides clarus]DAZ80189.1 MAG TPA: hypothetical protein [Caudoviricetes sp.]